jgi:hypothetical protein
MEEDDMVMSRAIPRTERERERERETNRWGRKEAAGPRRL